MKIRGFFPLNWFGIRGIVLYPLILYASSQPDSALEQHENIHWQQIMVNGVFSFYWNYVLEYLKGRQRGLSHDQAYREISFEKEAYTHQHNQSYIVNVQSSQQYRS
jgi:hypothetical protein